MTLPDLTGTTAVVTGASRGFGLGVSVALAGAGAHVVGVARTAGPLRELGDRLGESFTAVVADAADPAVARDVIGTHRPSILVLNAGVTPPLGPLHEMTWADFGRNWQVDARHAFHWTREALTAPLPPDSVVMAISSGAALRGSPQSGGYAGAKATIRFISSYAATESTRLGLGIRFVTVLPQLTPATELGAAGVAAYAERAGTDVATFVKTLEPVLTPDQFGRDAVGLLGAAGPAHAEYLLTGRGPREVS